MARGKSRGKKLGGVIIPIRVSDEFSKGLKKIKLVTKDTLGGLNSIQNKLSRFKMTGLRQSMDYAFKRSKQISNSLSKSFSKLGKTLRNVGLAGLAGGYAAKKLLIDPSAEGQLSRRRHKASVRGDDSAKRAKDEILFARGLAGSTSSGNISEVLDLLTKIRTASPEKSDDKIQEMAKGLINSAIANGISTQEVSESFSSIMRGMASRIDNIYGTGAVKKAGGLVVQDHMNQDGQIVKGKVFSDDQKFEMLQYMNTTKKNMIQEVKGTWGQVANQFAVTIGHLRDQFMLSGGVLETLSVKLSQIAQRFSTGDLSDKFKAFGESVSKFIAGFNIDTFFLTLKQAFADLKDFGVELKNIRMIFGGVGAAADAVGEAVANPYETTNTAIKDSDVGSSFLEGYSFIRNSISDLFKDHSMKRPESKPDLFKDDSIKRADSTPDMKITVDDKRTVVEMIMGEQVMNKAVANLGVSQ